MAARLTEEAAVLAATRAALDPERGAWQHDILVSTIVEVLSRKGSLSQRELSDQLGQTWVAQQTNNHLLSSALETAHAQGLIEKVEGHRGRFRWKLSEATYAEAVSDRRWAQTLLEELQRDVRAHLERKYRGSEEVANRAPKLTKALVGAMVRASRGVFQAVQSSASPTDMREVRFNLRAVIPDLRATVQPPDLADEVASLALAAADPDQSIGNEILQTIVAGQVLHGMVCRSDVQIPPPPTTLVLDTSQLLLLASHDAKVAGLFREYLATAKAHGCHLQVTDLVIAEWDNHWQLAEEQESRMRSRFGDAALEMYKLQEQSALASFSYAVGAGAEPSFQQWARERRNLHTVIQEFGIEVVDTLAADYDREFASEFSAKIAASMEESGRAYIRSQKLRDTDGISAALVHAARQRAVESLVPAGWFVATDRHSDEAYRSMATDDFPLCLTAATWLLYYSAFDPSGSRQSRAQLADRISEDLVLEAFLSVAASYTTDDMLELGDLLDDRDALDADDVKASIVESFLNPKQSPGEQVKDLARARIQRQSARAIRTKEEEGRQSREHLRELDRRDSEIAKLQEQLGKRDTSSAQQRRITEAVVASAICIVALVLVSAFHWASTRVVVVAWVVMVVLSPVVGYRYVRDIQRSRLGLAVEAVGFVGFAALSLVLDNGFHLGSFSH